MKRIYIVLLAGMAFWLSSCYEQQTWVDANVTEGGKYFPVIQLMTVSNTPASGSFAVGAEVKVAVQYWSVDPVKSLDLYSTVNGTESLFSSTPYSYSYDADAKAEIMTLSYTVPAAAAGSTVNLKVKVLCENDLSREKSTVISVQ